MRKFGKFAAFLFLFLLLIAFPYIKGDRETKTLDEAARAAMPDKSFIKLDDGVTHYELAGPEDGPKVVFIHGLSSPSFIWEHQFKAAADAGFRVLRYDNYGRGLSDRPDVAYDADLFDRQLLNLLDALGFTQPVTLVGLSMGGTTTIHFTDRRPDRVKAFVLFAPGGVFSSLPSGAGIITLPGVGMWFARGFGDFYFDRIAAAEFTTDPEQLAAIRARYADQMQYKGFKRAILRTIRDNPLCNLDEVFARAGAHGKPSMLIWGTLDPTVPYELHTRVTGAIPNIEFHTIEGAAHAAPYEVPDKVNPLLIEFLKKHAAP